MNMRLLILYQGIKRFSFVKIFFTTVIGAVILFCCGGKYAG